MSTGHAAGRLLNIPVRHIDRNPDNPRLIFRQGELDDLLESIRQYGVQVPIAVYKDGHRYTLIDGERRWRCSLKLNRDTIPAIVLRKPDQLDNLLMMFNIHSLREQWDLMTIALKLPRIESLLNQRLERAASEAEVSHFTGLSRAIIRRCRLLAALPDRFKNEIRDELKKPKAQQRITEDLFIEMERSLKTVMNRMPDIVDDPDQVRDVLLDKYKNDVYRNRVDLRQVAKIANAGNVGADEKKARKALRKLFTSNEYSIDDAYRDTVQEAYAERDVLSRITGLHASLRGITPDELDDDVRRELRELYAHIESLLEDSK